MNYLPHRTKLTIYKLLEGSRVKSLLAKIYMLVTVYEHNDYIQKNNKILFFINHEKFLRHDHIEQLDYIYKLVNERLGYEVSYMKVKRVFTWNIMYILSNLVNYKSFFNIVKEQMDTVIKDIDTTALEKIVVFTDNVSLQNYLCEIYANTDVRTYSMQHGFYIADTNKTFSLVYKSSNAKYFFIWDERTLRYMTKYDKFGKRHFIKSGPFSKSMYQKREILIKKDKTGYQIGIYGCGKDQIEQNSYLVDLYKYLKKNTKYNITFISHPGFDFFYRIYMSLKYKIMFSANKYKNRFYNINLVLNSAVWLELAENEQKYYILNDDFSHNVKYKKVYDNFINSQDKIINPLQPFTKDKEAVNIIVNKILE